MFPRKPLHPLLLLMALAAGPASAIQPGGMFGPAATSATVSTNAGEVERAGEENLVPIARFKDRSTNDCLYANRSFQSRNTVQPSQRRVAIAACSELASDAVADQAPE